MIGSYINTYIYPKFTDNQIQGVLNDTIWSGGSDYLEGAVPFLSFCASLPDSSQQIEQLDFGLVAGVNRAGGGWVDQWG